MDKVEKWWKEHYRLAEQTRGKIEGIGVREEMARTYYDQGEYSKSAKMWDEMAQIAEKFPSTVKEAHGYRVRAKKIKEKARSSSALEEGISLNVIISILSIVIGLFFFAPRMTGNAIGATWISPNIIGIALIFLGILGCFVYIKKKNKSSIKRSRK